MKLLEGSVIGKFVGHVCSESVPFLFAGHSLGPVGGGSGFAVPNINLDASAPTHENLAY